MHTMRCKVLKHILAAAAFVALPVFGYAQQATISGAVTDPAGKPIAAVQIVATHVESGEKIDTASDANGGYRLPVRVGAYQILFSAPGFATVNRTGVELLVGQQGIINIQMTASTEARTITVTGVVELANVGGSTNFDVQRTADTPINGRDVNVIAQGAVGNAQRAQNQLPVDTAVTGGGFQTNYDGQRVTQNLAGGFGQTRYSRDALGQIEFVQNRYDAASGQALMQQNAVTKSGTNKPAGTFSGFFRSDKLDGGDFATPNTAASGCATVTYPLPADCRTVLPYSDQQFAATYGGPIIKDKLHYFADFEYENNPHTLSYNTGYKTFDAVQQLSDWTQKIGMARFDYELSPATRLAVRGNESTYLDPFDARYGGGNARAPSTPLETHRHSDDILAILTQVLSPRALNQINAGYSSYYWWQNPDISWSTGCGYTACQPYPTLSNGSMLIQFPGITIGNSHTNSYQRLEQDNATVSDAFTYSFNAKGAHNLKLGGNYAHMQDPVFLCNQCMGVLSFSGNPSGPLAIIPGGNLATPTDGSLESLFPNASLNQKLWNLAPLSPWANKYTVGLGQMQVYAPMQFFGTYLQDDWKMSTRLTLNLGVRYDYETGVWAQDFDAVANGIGKWLDNGRGNYSKAFAPRIGFAYKLNDKETIRGGWGLYWTDPGSNTAFWTHLWGEANIFAINNPNPLKASNFASDPFGCLANPSLCTPTPAGGLAPTLAQANANLCTALGISTPATITSSGCFRRTITGAFASNDTRLPYSYNTSIGLAQQLTKNSAFAADFVFTQNRQGINTYNQNLAYNPATGVNYAFTNLTDTPDPQFQAIQGKNQTAENNLYSIQGGFTKRLANKWTLGVTYLWQKTYTDDVYPVLYNPAEATGTCTYPETFTAASGFSCNVPITLQPYINTGTWYWAPATQKITINGTYQAPWGITVGANYLWGNPTWVTPTYAADPTNLGSSGSYRVIPIGKTPVPAALAMGFQACTAAGAVDTVGCLIPRYAEQEPGISKLDMRVTKNINTGTHIKLQAILEVFNVLNHVNYVSTGSSLSTAATFNTPSSSTNVTYFPRMAQIAFRATF